MLDWFSPFLTPIWGPFRLLSSHLFLIGLGALLAAGLTWHALLRWSSRLPRDRGRMHAAGAAAAKGKPTGAGLIVFAVFALVAVAVVPFSAKVWATVGCLGLAMVSGFADDRSRLPWGAWRKGLLDLGIALLTAWVLCGGQSTTIWLPVLKQAIVVPAVVYVPMGAALLWFVLNATNCSDGVDGLAGSLTLVSLLCLAGLLYGVVGHLRIAAYLLVPHNPEGATWAVLLFTAAGGLGGYLWHNADPSRLLMGDAGSRFFGLLVGIAVLAAGNPVLAVVVAPVVLVNGGGGLGKLALLRLARRGGLDVGPDAAGQPAVARGWAWRRLAALLHRYRFPLHDHCRKNLGWSNAQVLVRFMLLQALLMPVLLVLLLKLR